jgi:hypothetical protein
MDRIEESCDLCIWNCASIFLLAEMMLWYDETGDEIGELVGLLDGVVVERL